MTFETPDDVLEHFGVKGMHWGVRRQKSSSSEEKSSSSKKKRAIKIAVGAGVVVAGAALATAIIRNNGRVSTSTLSSRSNAARITGGARAAPRIAARARVTTSAAGDIARMRSEIASSIRSANSELRSRDNALNIPIHARSYLTEWD